MFVSAYSVVRFPNPLATGRLYGSWGTWLHTVGPTNESWRGQSPAAASCLFCLQLTSMQGCHYFTSTSQIGVFDVLLILPWYYWHPTHLDNLFSYFCCKFVVFRCVSSKQFLVHSKFTQEAVQYLTVQWKVTRVTIVGGTWWVTVERNWRPEPKKFWGDGVSLEGLYHAGSIRLLWGYDQGSIRLL